MLRRIALGLTVVLVLACYVVPYAFLGDHASWTGAFLFWTLAGLMVIVLNILAVARFGEQNQ